MVTITKPEYISKAETYTTMNRVKHSRAWMIGHRRTICYVVKNNTKNSVAVKLQLSPEAVTWLDDQKEVVVPGLTNIFLVPNLWCKYIRVAYRSAETDKHSNITLLYTAQS